MKLVFFGSDDFAAESLQSLIKQGFKISACVTQPDRPRGRGLQVIASMIKVIALDNHIPLLQPENLRDQEFLRTLKSFGADLFIVIAYGKILPSVVLNIPKIFCLNVHGSLLPKYRGAAPINWAIINGDQETGFSIIKMSPKMDAGEIIVQEKMAIGKDENALLLRERMAKASAICLCQIIPHIAVGQFTLTPQDESKVTIASKLTKELGNIQWNKTALEIHNQIRGLVPWPGAYTFYQGKLIKIVSTRVCPKISKEVPGTILEVNKDGILVATAKDAILILQVHPESGKLISAGAFASGQRIKVGNFFDLSS